LKAISVEGTLEEDSGYDGNLEENSKV